MERREFLLRFAKAAAFLAVPPAFSSLASAHSPLPQIGKAKPYGADKLENTNHGKLTASLKNQLQDAGLSLPADTYQPFPGKNWKPKSASLPLPLRDTGLLDMFPPFLFNLFEFGLFGAKPKDEYATPREIVGTSLQNRDLEEDTQFFNQNFKGQPSCSLQVRPAAWAADSALHETIHYVTFTMIFDDGVSLQDVTYSTVNKVSPAQDRDSYLASLRTSLKEHPASEALNDRLMLAEATYRQIGERMADAGAALYALSNYSNTPAIIDYYEKLADYRDAYFTDSDHYTTSSIRAALKTFSETPRKGLTIIEAALWAGTVVVTQPEFQRNLGEMARDAKNRSYARDKFLKNKGEFVSDQSDKNDAEISKIFRTIGEARNSVCGASAPSP